MKMSLREIFIGLILLTALLDCAAQAQTATDQPQRREGEIWFEPIKAEVGGQTFEGERGHLMVRENRKNPQVQLNRACFRSPEKHHRQARISNSLSRWWSRLIRDRSCQLSRLHAGFSKTARSWRRDTTGPARRRPFETEPDLPHVRIIAHRCFCRPGSSVEERSRNARRWPQIIFVRKGVDILAYNSVESAHDVDDLRKALGVEKVNLVGFSYGTHLGLACIRYHGKNLNRVVLDWNRRTRSH